MKGRLGSYAKSNPKVISEAKDKHEGAVLSAEASKHPMELGAKVDGKRSAMRLDRPGRKRGGRVGADCAPLSSAATVSGRSDATNGN